MLPSSHSFRGRWTCRSTARITSGGEWLRFFDADRIAEPYGPALDDAGDHAAPADQLLLQSQPDLVHAEARLADLGDLEQRSVAEAQTSTDRQSHDVQSLDCQVLLDRSRRHSYRVERLFVREQHLT